MNIDFRKVLYAVALIVIQCILDNFVDLGIYVRIVLIPCIILVLPYRYRTISSMLLAFIIGVCVDIFTTGIIGLNAGALTAVAFVRQKLLHAILDERNMERHDSPDVKVMGMGKAVFYLFSSYLVFFCTYIFLDNFGFRPFGINIIKIVAGTIISSTITLWIFKNHKKA